MAGTLVDTGVEGSGAMMKVKATRPVDSIQEIIELYKRDVDVTLLDANLDKTVEERIRALEEFEAFREELHAATERSVIR